MKFLYYTKIITNIYYLYISPSVILNILSIAYRKKHLGFSYYYKIIIYFLFIQNLIKLFQAFI